MDKKYLVIGFVITFLAVTAWKYNAGQKDDWSNRPDIGVTHESSELCTAPPCYFQKGEILVTFKKGVFKSYADAIVAVHGYTVFYTPEQTGIHAYGLKVPEGKEAEAIAKFKSESTVAYASPNFLNLSEAKN